MDSQLPAGAKKCTMDFPPFLSLLAAFSYYTAKQTDPPVVQRVPPTATVYPLQFISTP